MRARIYMCVCACVCANIYTSTLICVHTCTEHFAETLSPFSALGRGAGQSRASVRLEVRGPFCVPVRRGVVAVHKCPRAGARGGPGAGSERIPRPWGWRGPGLCRLPRRAAPGARLRLLAARHPRGTVGTGIASLGVLQGPLFVFFCTFFILFFSPRPGSLPSPWSVLAPDLIQPRFIAAPRDLPSRVQARIAQGLLPPHLAEVPEGTKGLRGRCGEKGHGDTQTHPQRAGRAFQTWRRPPKEDYAVPTLLLLCPLPRLFQSLSSSGGKQGGKWVTAGGAARRARHRPARVNPSLPSSACSDWRIWGCILDSFGCRGGRVFSEGAEGKETPV